MSDRLKVTDRPRWYGLEPKNTADLVVSVHRKAWAQVRKMVTSASPLVEDLQKRLQLPEFMTGKYWGFANSLRVEKSTDPQWVQLHCQAPHFNGRLHRNDSAIAKAASLYVLFEALGLYKGAPDCKKPQLMSIESLGMGENTLGGWGLTVLLSPAMCAHLEKHMKSSNATETFLMPLCVAANRIYDRLSFPSTTGPSVRCSIEHPKYLLFDFPGNDCKFETNRRDSECIPGAVMRGNNMDSPLDQLATLAMLAFLHENYK